MADKEVAYDGFEYRMQGGEMHRRPIDREGLLPWQGAWLVLNQGRDHIPSVVQQQFAQPETQLRYD